MKSNTGLAYHVRRAHVDEAEKIAICLELAFEPFRSQYTSDAYQGTVLTPDAIRGRMAQMRVYVAVSCDGTVIGTLAAAAEEGQGHLRGIAVRLEWQGHGVAEQLLAQAECDLLAAGCTHVTLDTTDPLRRAVRF
jgi:N-acetylglutamate synthase-like GNAT family acetyltransferase